MVAEYPEDTRNILGSCHVSFDNERLVIKIGGYKDKYRQKAEKTTEVLKFSPMTFTTSPDLKVTS